jgi:hypothetical protein
MTPPLAGFMKALRREGDSNPRYSYPYGSLANCWFKPLTHLSFRLAERDKNRKSCNKRKIIQNLFQTLKQIYDHPEILKALLIKIG